MPDNINVSLPYNLEAEQSVLGSILAEPSCLNEVVDILKPDSFYLPQHREIFSILLQMFTTQNGVIDPVLVADALAKSGKYDIAGGKEYLVQLFNAVPSTANVVKYAKIVQEQYYLRTLIQTAQTIIDDASSGSGDASVILDSAEQKIYDIRQGKESNGPTKISEVIFNGVYGKLTELTGENAADYKGIPSGFGTLDKFTTGLNKSDFILIGARPAMGKTSFALNLAHNVSVIGKKKCIFFSLEMTKEQLAERLLASQAGVASNKFRTGELNDDEWIRVGNAAAAFDDVELYLDDTSSITVPEIKSRVRRLKGVDIIIIDYLGLVQSAVRKENRVQEVSEITRNLKMMAKDLNIPVVCCAQLSRGTE
ncbi:MAG: replicative DNA helicase, partial [Eubacterium sp.]|nr:replicative DNA helicase [Eubacterium sp.]